MAKFPAAAGQTSYMFRGTRSLIGMARTSGGSRHGLGTGGLELDITVVGQHDGLLQLKRFSDSPRTILEQIAFAGAQAMGGEIVKAMTEPKSGMWWAHLPNRSSSKDEFPAVQSGALLNSMRIFVMKSPASTGIAAVGFGKGLPRNYAFYLEYGTMYMAPRSYARRAAVQFRAETIEAMGTKWAELRRANAISRGRSRVSGIVGGSDW